MASRVRPSAKFARLQFRHSRHPWRSAVAHWFTNARRQGVAAASFSATIRSMATPTLIAARGTSDATALLAPVLEALGRIIIGKDASIATRRRVPARARPLADRGPARRRQDHPRARARSVARLELSADSVHERPVACRRARRVGVSSRQRPIRVPQGTDLRAARPGRRDQPRDAESSERAARRRWRSGK